MRFLGRLVTAAAVATVGIAASQNLIATVPVPAPANATADGVRIAQLIAQLAENETEHPGEGESVIVVPALSLFREGPPPPTCLYPDKPLREDFVALAKMDRAAVPALIDALDKHASSPRRCMSVLGLIGPSAAAAAPHIAPYLKDVDPETRAVAAWALRQIDSPACSQSAALMAALDDPDPLVSYNVMRALDASAMKPADLVGTYMSRWQHQCPVGPPPPANAIKWEERDLDLDGGPGALSHPLIDKIIAAGPAASATVPLLVTALHDLRIHFQAHAPFDLHPHWISSGMRATPPELLQPAIAEMQAARMLDAFAPLARPCVPGIVELIRYHLRPGAGWYENQVEPNGAAYAWLRALRKIEPASPAGVDLLLAGLRQTRSDEITAAKLNMTQWEWYERRNRVTGFARGIEILDPGNAAARKILLDDLKAGVDAGERIWAVEMAADFRMRPEEILPALLEMTAHGQADSLKAALMTAKTLGPAIDPTNQLLAAIHARLKTDPAFQKMLESEESLSAAIGMHMERAEDDPATAAFLKDQAAKNSAAFDHAALFAGAESSKNAGMLEDLITSASLRDEFDRGKVLQAPKFAARLAEETDPAKRNELIVALAKTIDWHAVFDAAPLQKVLLRAIADQARGDSNALIAAYRLLALTPWNDAVIKALHDAMVSSTPEMRHLILQSVSSFPAAALPMLLEAYEVASGEDRRSLGWTIMGLGKETPLDVAFLSRFFRADDDNQKGAYAAVVLNAKGSKDEKIKLLLPMIASDEDRFYRVDAIQAALAIGTATPELKAALFDVSYRAPDERVREAARQAIKKMFP